MNLKITLFTLFAGFFVISVSGILISVCPSQIDGTPCQVICKTPDFSQTIIFKKDATTAGYCLSGGTCSTGISGYSGPYRVDTNQTVLNISAYDRTRDIGQWTCSYGGSVSPPEIMNYAIPPTSATITPNNFTLNSKTQITVTTDCAYINISGVIQFKSTAYRQRQMCTEVPFGGCASGRGEKYTCIFTLSPGDFDSGKYELEFTVDLPYDDTNPKVNFATPVYVTIPESLTTTETTNEIHYTSTASIQFNYTNNATKLGPGELGGIALGAVMVLSIIIVTFIVCIATKRKRSGERKGQKNSPS